MNSSYYSPQSITKRLNYLVIWVVLCGLFLIVRLAHLQIWQHSKYLALAESIHLRKYQIPAKRGQIYIHDGADKTPLVLNETLKLMYADPRFITDKVKVAKSLAETTGDSYDSYYGLLARAGAYVPLKSRVTDDMATKIKKLNLPGIGLVDQSYRIYPEGNLASQITGFVNADGQGQYGLEGFFNGELAGLPGLLKAKTDTLGIPIATVDNTLRSAIDGNNYVITVDRSIQAQAEKYLKTGVESVGAKSGSVVILDPSSGAVLAMANYPTFDPNDYRNVSDYNTFSNAVTSDQFEPGSGFKIMTMAAGLDTGKVKPDTTYEDTGKEEISGRVIRNAENHVFGRQNMTDVIQKSLNTGVIFVLKTLGGDAGVINNLGKKTLYDYITKHFGFGVRTGIEQANEAQGLVNPPSANDVNYANMSFGQGISVTMIQMVAAFAAIANGGKLYQPYIIDQTIKPDGTIITNAPKVVNTGVVSKQAASDVTQMMTQVVEHGSGYAAKMKGYRVAGKTGTAQIPKADGQGYEEGKNIGTFTGFAPADNARFVMMVRVNEPKVAGFAESTTVPIFAHIAEWLLRYYAIPPTS